MSNKKLPALKNSPKHPEYYTQLSIAEKRIYLQERVTHYRHRLDKQVYRLRRDATQVAIWAGTAYLGYLLLRGLRGGKRARKQATLSKRVQPEYILVKEKPRARGSLLWTIANSRLVSYLLDNVIERWLDRLPIGNQGHDKS